MLEGAVARHLRWGRWGSPWPLALRVKDWRQSRRHRGEQRRLPGVAAAFAAAPPAGVVLGCEDCRTAKVAVLQRACGPYILIVVAEHVVSRRPDAPLAVQRHLAAVELGGFAARVAYGLAHIPRIRVAVSHTLWLKVPAHPLGRGHLIRCQCSHHAPEKLGRADLHCVIAGEVQKTFRVHYAPTQVLDDTLHKTGHCFCTL
mmetsp:Transcript_47649/g.110396  ORF Transcript_47649/g.110396 Transcript_47649/m.110396 type:complete len:201 (+) Transcript_47649:507-1109(+)